MNGLNLTFQFESLADFAQMAGHGPYVWACYGITALALVYLVVAPIQKRKNLLKNLQRQKKIAEQSKLTRGR